MIVGAHGAGLTDMIFTPPASSILELLPSAHALNFFISVAAAAGIDHRYMLIESSMQTTPGGIRGQLADTTVDLDVFTLALEEMIAEAT
jgi:capsular polysaccharide biosynthesis protein